MDDFCEVCLTSLQDVAWQRVAAVQVKRYDVSRRMELTGPGPLKTLLGIVQRFAVELIHKDDTWDRVHWLESPVEAHRLANDLAAKHGLTVGVAP